MTLKKNEIFDCFFLCISMGSWLFILILVWFSLFHNGNIVLQFNNYGEMMLEIVVVSIIFVFIIYYIIKKIRSVFSEIL